MAVLDVFEHYEGRDGNDTAEGIRSYNRTFKVIVDDVEDNALIVLAAEGIPIYGNEHPPGSNYFVSNREADEFKSGDWQVWLAVVTYTFFPPDFSGGDAEAPWDDPPGVDYDYERREELLTEAYAGGTGEIPGVIGPNVVRDNPPTPVVNSALQAFDPAATIPAALLVIIISRNLQNDDFDPNDVNKFMNTINQEAIRVASIDIPPFEGWMRTVKSSKAFTPSGVLYWQTSWQILTDPRNHLKKLVDMGFFSLSTSSAGVQTYTSIKDDDDEPITEAVLLDGNGQKRAGTDPDEVHLRVFHGFWEEDWAILVPDILPPEKDSE